MGCCGKVRGAVKMARAELGLAVLRLPQLVDARRRSCEACDRWEHGRCLECKCYTWAKSLLPNEACPLGRWPSPDSFKGVPADKS